MYMKLTLARHHSLNKIFLADPEVLVPLPPPTEPVVSPVLEEIFNREVNNEAFTRADEVTVYTTGPTGDGRRKMTITRIKAKRKKVRKRKKVPLDNEVTQPTE